MNTNKDAMGTPRSSMMVNRMTVEGPNTCDVVKVLQMPFSARSTERKNNVNHTPQATVPLATPMAAKHSTKLLCLVSIIDINRHYGFEGFSMLPSLTVRSFPALSNSFAKNTAVAKEKGTASHPRNKAVSTGYWRPSPQ